MIVNCSGCAMRLQLDDAKIPAHSFTIKCPKCQTLISVQQSAANAAVAAAAASSATATMGDYSAGAPPAATAIPANNRTSDVMTPSLSKTSSPAPVFELKEETDEPTMSGSNGGGAHTTSETGELARVLAALLQRSAPPADKQRNASRLAWERRRALVCVAAVANREAVARSLAQSDYQTFVAEDVSQAIERMREERMDMVVLDPDFDPIEQGAAFVNREVSTLRPAERRRLFLVGLNSTARTGDAHAAFVSNVNLVVNPSDIENLPRALERALRDYNDLYSDFNSALNVAAL